MKVHVFPPSPNARKVLITLAELGLEADVQQVDLFQGQQKTPEFTKLNPNQLMPVLEDGDFVLWESNAIMQYLAAKKPASGLWPTDARTQADVSRWQSWQSAHWGTACGTFTFQNMVKQLVGGGDPDPAEVAKGEESFHRLAAVLNGHIAGKDWIVGNSMTLADISVGVWLTYWERARMPLAGYGEVKRWYDHLEQQASWKKAAPPPLPG